MNTTNCTCGNCPSARMDRGLAPFCQMDRTVRTPLPGFATIAEAATACLPGQTVVGKRGGVGHGPMRYFVRGKVAA
jgi:hypothetical protein